jgi:hypothetical protein
MCFALSFFSVFSIEDCLNKIGNFMILFLNSAFFFIQKIIINKLKFASDSSFSYQSYISLNDIKHFLNLKEKISLFFQTQKELC